ncbi:hypothetical protein D3C87_1150820 [compost metagenome]
MAAPVLLVDVLDDLLAPRVFDVEIDVGRLGPFFRDEALEEQPHAHRVDGGDAETVADDGVCGGTSALAEDIARSAERDDLVHGQEVPAVLQALDDPKFDLELTGDFLGDRAVALRGARVGKLAQPLGRRLAVRETLGQVTVAQLCKREGASFQDLVGTFHRGRVGGEQGGESRRSQQRVLSVGLEPSAGRMQRKPMPDAGEHVLERPAVWMMVEHLRGGCYR